MFLIADETINNLLKEDYKYLKTIYKQDRILGLFTYGKLNYGFAENISEVQVKMYYLPSLEEMCTSTEWKDEIIEYNNHTINIKDIRLILQNIIDQEGTSMECFYSKHYIITPKFKTVFIDSILTKREEIFHCNPKKRIEHTVSKAFEALTKYEQTDDPEYLFELCRRRLAADLYLKGHPCEDCIYLKKDYHRTYLWSIKQGQSMPNIKEVIDDLKDMKRKAATLETHPELEELVTSVIVEIIKIALTRTIDEEEFLNMLTDTEKNALKIIMTYLENGEGVVSISQLVNTHAISRPVFKSVLQKMKDMEIAEINNMGVKGTAIKIIDGVFLNIDDYID